MSQRQDRDHDLRSDIEAELEAHLELFVEEQTKLGIDPEEARATAELRFGDRTKITTTCLSISQGDSIMNRNLILTLSALILVGFGLFATQVQIRQLQSTDGTPQIGGSLFPRKPEQVIAQVGGSLTLVDRSGSHDMKWREYTIQKDGMVLLPEIGWLSVAGQSRPAIEATITEFYGKYYAEPPVIYVVVGDPESRQLAAVLPTN